MAVLPQPNGAFTWAQAAGRPALICEPLAEVAPHLFTARDWLLGQRTAVDAALAWHEVAGAIDVDADLLIRAHQVHGTSVVVATANDRGRHAIDDADILVSSGGPHALAVQAADCVPLLIADRKTGAIAAAHAGWRGLAARVPSTVVAALRRHCGSRPQDLIAAVGPSIGACCYEVGPDVVQRFQRAGFAGERLAEWFLDAPARLAANPPMPGVAPRPDHWFFDGWAASRDQLVGAGVPAAEIFVAELCTASHPAALCSYRRDGAPAGRMAGVIRRRRPHP